MNPGLSADSGSSGILSGLLFRGVRERFPSGNFRGGTLPPTRTVQVGGHPYTAGR